VLPKVLDNINDAFIPAVSVLIGMISLGLTGPEMVFSVLFAVYLSLLKVRVPKASPGQFV
jgi:ABC-type antimicrobial peptide transport system permease subunit